MRYYPSLLTTAAALQQSTGLQRSCNFFDPVGVGLWSIKPVAESHLIICQGKTNRDTSEMDKRTYPNVSVIRRFHCRQFMVVWQAMPGVTKVFSFNVTFNVMFNVWFNVKFNIINLPIISYLMSISPGRYASQTLI